MPQVSGLVKFSKKTKAAFAAFLSFFEGAF